MTAYHVQWPVERSSENVMSVLSFVISNFRMKQISHNVCIPSTPFFQLSYPSQSTSPLSQSPVSGIWLLFILLSTWCNSPLPAKPNPLQAVCSKQSHFHPDQRSAIHRYQHAPSEATFTATSKARSTANSLLPASQFHPNHQSQIHCYQWSKFHPYQQSQIHHKQLAPSEVSFIPTIEARSTATSEPSFTPTSEAKSIVTSWLPMKSVSPLHLKPDPLLPAKLVSPLPAKPDPPLPACSQPSQIVREVRVRIPPLPACSSEAWSTATSEAKSSAPSQARSTAPAKPDPPLTAWFQLSQIVRQVRVIIPPLPASSPWSQIHCYYRG